MLSIFDTNKYQIMKYSICCEIIFLEILIKYNIVVTQKNIVILLPEKRCGRGQALVLGAY